MSNNCLGCGTEHPETDPQPSNCPSCPDELCPDCGQWNRWATGENCLCWESLEHLGLADLKALFAHDGTFNVGVGGALSPTGGEQP